MKKAVLLILIVAICCFVGCSKTTVAEEFFSSTAFFGTYVEVYLASKGNSQVDKQNLSSAKMEMVEFMERAQKVLDADDQLGDVARFNALNIGQSIKVDKIFAECFELAKSVYDLTNGAYNPAVYSLVDLWGFSSRVLSGGEMSYPYDRQTQSVPQQKYIDAFCGLTNFEGIELTQNGEEYFATKPYDVVVVDGNEYTLKIDFGGIAKGYVGDKIKSIADKYGIDRGYFMIGQSSITFLDSVEGKGYDLDMENPLNTSAKLFTKEGLKNTSISVSGDYQRYFEENGKKYCHIINPKTGYPVASELKAVFLQCQSSAICDALTTALMTYSVEDIAKISQSKEFEELGVYSVVMVLNSDDDLKVVSNARDLEIAKGIKRLKFDINQGEVEFFVSRQNSPLPLVLLCCVGLVVACAIFVFKRKGKANKEYNLKLFLKGDLVAYVCVLALVVVTFLIPIKSNQGEMNRIDLYCGEDLVLTYDVQADLVDLVSVDYQEVVKIEKTEGKILATVYFDKQKNQYNKIEFANGQAKVIQATCNNKDCTKTFSKVVKANQVVVCMPYSLRLVGVGKGNLGVR